MGHNTNNTTQGCSQAVATLLAQADFFSSIRNFDKAESLLDLVYETLVQEQISRFSASHVQTKSNSLVSVDRIMSTA